MRKYKKIISVMAIGAMALSMVAGCSKKTSDNYTVGIGQFAQHGSLDNCREGFIEGLKEEGKVTLVGFGTFSAKTRAAREGINPLTKETIKIPAKTVASFKAGSKLKDALN